MAGLTPEGSQFDAKMKDLLQVDGGDECFTSDDEDYENAKFNRECEIQPENEKLTPEQYAACEKWYQSLSTIDREKLCPSYMWYYEKLDRYVQGLEKRPAIKQRGIVLDVNQQNAKFTPECKFRSLQSIKDELEKCVHRNK